MGNRVRSTSNVSNIAAILRDMRPAAMWLCPIFSSASVGPPNRSNRLLLILGGLAITLLMTGSGLALQGEHGRMSNVRVLWNDDDLLVMEGGMSIDADGAPQAYSPIPEQGLDALEHAGSPEHWDGIATREGEPIVQGLDDPAPGYYVSTTALQDFSFPFYRQERYVDASQVPYIALPETDDGPRLGDLALVVNTRTHKVSPAIFADIASLPGEGSIALARQLGIHSDARRGGTDGGVLYFVFNNSGDGTLPDSEDMVARVKELWSNSAVQDAWNTVCSQHPDLSCDEVALGADEQTSNAEAEGEEAQ